LYLAFYEHKLIQFS